jgi:prepilin-type N-terminal cleavage/methylation domain-containing protein/prepilin-type processing-associated H-X9-DG protein
MPGDDYSLAKGQVRSHALVISSAERKQAMRSRVRRKGFTLIELLVVIAIIAILAAILFPVFAQARARARAITCVSSIKEWGTAAMMYIQDYDEKFPKFFRLIPNYNPKAGHTPQSGWNASGYYWHEAILPYIKNYQTLLCLQAPMGALNSYCLPYGWSWAFVHDNSIAEFQFPAETLLIVDGRGRPTIASDRASCNALKAAGYPWPCADCLEGGYNYGHGIIPPATYATDPAKVNLNAGYSVSDRHFGKANIVFMDGHVASRDAVEVNRCNNYWDGDGIGGPCRVGKTNPKYDISQ